METIRNYLETMFRGLPQTEKIMKAKSELLQMMEDKYTELIRNGKTENEAVGEVIQNFGNLDELAEDLGIKDILHQTKYSEVQRRKLSFEEVTDYLAAAKKSFILLGLGIFFCITCVMHPVIADAFRINETIGVVAMFVSIAVGVVLICFSKGILEQWRFLRSSPCSLDSVSMDYLKNKVRDFTPTFSVLLSIGVLLCVLCFLPTIIFSEIGGNLMDELGAAMLFVFVGAGVFMIVYAKSMKTAYHRLLKINDNYDFEVEDGNKKTYSNKSLEIFMSVYWTSVVCLYLCVSFITFHWEITWIIWPIAAVANAIIRAVYMTDSDTKKE